MLTRLPSLFFMLALASYYLPKWMNKKHKMFIKLHIITGILSMLSMLILLVMYIGTPELMKYIGFMGMMLGITWTGKQMMDGKTTMRKAHGAMTVGFFVYLVIVICL